MHLLTNQLEKFFVLLLPFLCSISRDDLNEFHFKIIKPTLIQSVSTT